MNELDCDFIFGYHGTDNVSYKQIIEKGFVQSQRSGSWLGYGAYFFFQAPRNAYEWASTVAKRRAKTNHDTRTPIVVKAKIDLTGCVNLLDSGYWDIMREAFKSVRPDRNQIGPGYLYDGSDVDRNMIGVNHRDFDAVNTFVGLLRDEEVAVDSIIAAFPEGDYLEKQSWLFDRSSVMICVKNLDRIEILGVQSLP